MANEAMDANGFGRSCFCGNFVWLAWFFVVAFSVGKSNAETAYWARERKCCLNWCTKRKIVSIFT